MKIIRYEYNDIHGTVHVACFMSWCGVRYGCPVAAALGMCEWLEGHVVWCEPGGNTRTDQSQRQ